MRIKFSEDEKNFIKDCLDGMERIIKNDDHNTLGLYHNVIEKLRRWNT